MLPPCCLPAAAGQGLPQAMPRAGGHSAWISTSEKHQHTSCDCNLDVKLFRAVQMPYFLPAVLCAETGPTAPVLPISCHTPRAQTLLLALVQRQYLLHVTLASHDDWAAVVDVLWLHLQDAPNPPQEHAGRRHAPRLLGDHGHGVALIQHAQLALFGLLVCRVQEDAAVEQSAVHVGN